MDEHAPGRQDPAAGLAAAHHLLLGHGLTVRELRSRDASLDLGITLNLTVADPVNPGDPADINAARVIDGQFNRFFLDPLFRGSYPEDVLADVAGLGFDGVVQPGDLEIISTPFDVLGVNYYHGESVSGHPGAIEERNAAPSERPKRSPFPAADGVLLAPPRPAAHRDGLGGAAGGSHPPVEARAHRIHRTDRHRNRRDRERRRLRRCGVR